ncbi:hypothetical protein FHR81_003981 [Actinoalloteichus hoggarensis]|uniref:Uncharacterized protein n=2 Tax=Actinoalloteichus TaxID=65496 RepID=A0A221VWF1_9PSEU|nr:MULTISPECIES: hypothetical protein [Actinoalloteichus]APU12226.1 hypothetical protein UA74_00635 [Actinoalloteichus fjordicus]APU18178.1 hypothetical protein UA75_00635 [Actinoalloteichus sp. GBA129-24]ASO17797.1 hypothetical protein AHOG_00620 [Actinoalloteichus hoggarensis]MBB5922924.1 hypothetical protein [Actinoalloteichus hoggarensis]
MALRLTAMLAAFVFAVVAAFGFVLFNLVDSAPTVSIELVSNEE